ncbi:MAG TPA: CcdB family protein [Wenzhouxiangella sp.]|nr:CcdB family protein [Wenzhouxiangella sp.]
MAQFDVYANPDPESCRWAPCIVDLQHDMLDALATRIMAPLLIARTADETIAQRLNPIINFEGERYYLSAAEIASVPVRELSEPLGNLSSYRDDLLAAVDMVFTAI